jgi:DNA-binding XRE family transcriptional regulator
VKCILQVKRCILPHPDPLLQEREEKTNRINYFSSMTEKTIHEGKNVKRIREILGIKQDALAMELGLSQQAVSALEQKEKIDEKILDDVAKVLKVPVDAIKSFN